MQVCIDLLHRYNVAVPRYTSYPTVPYWKEGIEIAQYQHLVSNQLVTTNQYSGISLYIHLPFCESLCTYCGCNKKITTHHGVETTYLQAVITEWELYVQQMGQKPIIRELHIGGGTPTFFSPQNLQLLLTAILSKAIVHPQHEFSFEGHPNNTTTEHLQVLYDLGFRRVSFGVQDNNPQVQHIINRIQPFEQVQKVTQEARRIGYTSVNFDLIYGLPLQTEATIEATILQCIALKPDRVAFYSYAHVPWTSKGQRLFSEADLPTTRTKMLLYQKGKQLFAQNGYTDIGMDHFALPTDSLYRAWKNGALHRNFMGYTTQQTQMLLGLGVSSISDIGVAYAQNHKTIHDYYAAIAAGSLAINKGYFLTDEDVAFRQYILNISCTGKTLFNPNHFDTLYQYTFQELKILKEDNLIEWDAKGMVVTALGRHFIRNICKAFDLHLLRTQYVPKVPQFSKAI